MTAGTAAVSGEQARFAWPVPTPIDPLTLARAAAALPRPARVVVRERAAVVEGTCPADEVDAVLAALAASWPPAAPRSPAIEDLSPGVLAPAPLAITAPVFLRLAAPATAVVDRARATYLLTANAALRTAVGGWIDGPGLAVEPGADAAMLGAEVHEVGRALRALGEERIAQHYLEVCGIT